jgi:hypothetical protein
MHGVLNVGVSPVGGNTGVGKETVKVSVSTRAPIFTLVLNRTLATPSAQRKGLPCGARR